MLKYAQIMILILEGFLTDKMYFTLATFKLVFCTGIW